MLAVILIIFDRSGNNKENNNWFDLGHKGLLLPTGVETCHSLGDTLISMLFQFFWD